MKKIVLASLMSSLSLSSFVHAGAMGDAGCAPSGFVSLEGGYTWNSINGVEVTVPGLTFSPTKQLSQLSGRIAGGIIHMIDDSVGITGELGWGYYGRTTFSVDTTFSTVPVSLSSKYTITGFDVLVGVASIQTYYTLYAKVGGIIQNMQQNNTAIFTTPAIVPLPGTVYHFNDKHTSAAVLPAIKLGAGYNIDANWSITGSYLFAYGANTKTQFNYSTSPTVLVAKVNTQNPMMNAFMLGIQYSV
jgi:hypothetical protein